MNFMEAKSVCKKHPYNNPQQGVCSSCLAEKLSNLTTTPCNYPSYYLSYNSHTHAKSTQVGAASSYSPPSNPSGHVSPPRVASHTRRHRGSDSAGLKKSRSMIVYASRKSGTTSDGAVAAAGGRSTGKMMMKKKGGFWAKLMCSTGKIRSKDVFTHSRSATCQQRFDLS